MRLDSFKPSFMKKTPAAPPPKSDAKSIPLGGAGPDGSKGTKGPMTFSQMSGLKEVPGKSGRLMSNPNEPGPTKVTTYIPGPKPEARSAGSSNLLPTRTPHNPLDYARQDARNQGLDFPMPGSSKDSSPSHTPTSPTSPGITRKSTLAPDLATIPERSETPKPPVPKGPANFEAMGVPDAKFRTRVWYNPTTWRKDPDA